MSTLRLGAQRVAWAGRFDPVAVPCALGLAYVVLVVLRFPQLIGWQNADSDVASTYAVATALFHGHAGQVQFSTQGSWAGLAWEFLTRSLPDHRLLWELWAPLLGALTGAALWWALARVAGRVAATLAAVLLLATSPDGLMNLVSAPWHNTSTLGAVLLGTCAVSLVRPERGRLRRAAGLVGIVAVTGVFLAGDHLLAVIGVLPFLVAATVASALTRDPRPALYALLAALGAGLISAAVTGLARRLDLRTATPGLSPATPHMMLVHLGWLGAGLMRLGNGIAVQPHDAAEAVLALAAAVVTVAGLAALVWVTVDALVRRAADPAAAVHATFWAASAACAVLAYVLTSAAYEPSDRYFFVVVVAVAATVPLLLRRGPRARLGLAAGAAVYLAAGVVAFAGGAMHSRAVIITSSSASQASRIAAIARRERVSVGYAGYWNASSLEWTSAERLHVAPLLGTADGAAPMFTMRVAAWYRRRPHVPSYLVLAPGDPTLPDVTPRWLPRPQRVVHVGAVTLEFWRFDIASRLGRSEIPLPGS